MYAAALLVLLVQVPDAEGLYRQGVAAFEAGRAAEAAPLLARACELAPGNAQYAKALGVVHASQRDYLGAIEPFRRACRLDPKLPDACYFFARALYGADKHAEALEALRPLERDDPQPPRIRLALAQSLDALGRPTEAEPHYRAAGPAGLLAYGKFLVRQGRPEEAVEALNSPSVRDSAERRFELGRACYDAGRAEAAAGHLAKAIELDQRHGAAYLLLAKCLRRLGRTAEAQEIEKKAQSLGIASSMR
jgi:tetratricopeptide (TPR) repeat protein